MRLTIDGEGVFRGIHVRQPDRRRGRRVVDGEAALTPAALIHRPRWRCARRSSSAGAAATFETDDVNSRVCGRICGFDGAVRRDRRCARTREFEAFQPRPGLERPTGPRARAGGIRRAAWSAPPCSSRRSSSGAIVDLDLAIFEQCCRFLRDRLDKGAVIVPLNCNFALAFPTTRSPTR